MDERESLYQINLNLNKQLYQTQIDTYRDAFNNIREILPYGFIDPQSFATAVARIVEAIDGYEATVEKVMQT